MDRLITASGYKGTPIVVSDGINTRTMEEDGKTVTDPHVWNSPVNVMVWVANIEKALAAADPEDAATFKANAESYRKQLKSLDAYAHEKSIQYLTTSARSSPATTPSAISAGNTRSSSWHRSAFRPKPRRRLPTSPS